MTWTTSSRRRVAFPGVRQVFQRHLVPGHFPGQTLRPLPPLPWVTQGEVTSDGAGLECFLRQEGEGKEAEHCRCKPQPVHKMHPNTKAQGCPSVSGWTKVTRAHFGLWGLGMGGRSEASLNSTLSCLIKQINNMQTFPIPKKLNLLIILNI